MLSTRFPLLAELNKRAVMAYAAPASGRAAALPHHDAERRRRMLDAVLWQAEHLQEVPALVIACLEFAARSLQLRSQHLALT